MSYNSISLPDFITAINYVTCLNSVLSQQLCNTYNIENRVFVFMFDTATMKDTGSVNLNDSNCV